MSNAVIMSGFCEFVCLAAVIAAASAGFYADNGLDRTISYRSLPKQEKREMENEILNLLGLDHRPKPKIHQTSNSAPKYLIDLYNKLDPESEDRNASLKDIDFVVSFVNHHNNEDDELSIEPKLHFDVSDISPQETVIHASLNLYRRDTRKKQVEPQPDMDDDADEGEIAYLNSDSPSVQADQTTTDSLNRGTTPLAASTFPARDVESTTEFLTTSTESQDSSSEHFTVDVVSSVVKKTNSTSLPDSITEVGEPATEDMGSGQTPSSSPAPSKARKSRSISPPLDYTDEFQFFEQPFQIQVFSIKHGNSVGEVALEAVATYSVGANETGWIQLNSTNALLNWVCFHYCYSFYPLLLILLLSLLL